MTTIDLAPIQAKTCLVRDTGKRRGRNISVTPETTAARHLHFGRIVLEASDPPVVFSTGELETGLLCLKGKATIDVDGKRFDVGRYDALYVPRDSDVRVSGSCDFAEIAAPVSNRYPIQVVRFADVQKDSSLHFHAGGSSSERDVNIVIGKNVDAGRILAGVTFSKPGNWTSWPPHEHSKMLEEAYLYIDMPRPSWGIQLVYNDPANPELVAVVREGDLVLMPQGYHPNVSAPGGTINFLWMMAAIREGEDRQFGVVNVQPEYAQSGSGLEASRK
ncbi:MAG TPA: 5-deoxy-glucuronate isomerase [Thermoanaerobaculia bacterium]|nr:5-deoxy-glucuronate isomerase [Thermoanaerobaculia bacterium]